MAAKSDEENVKKQKRVASRGSEQKIDNEEDLGDILKCK